MTVAVLAGGVGAARFLAGLVQVMDPADIVAIVNVADDLELHGLSISPDLDTVTYTLAGAINPDTGWGLRGESWAAMGALGRFSGLVPAGSTAGATWFGLGDQDLATHMYRTHRLREGATLSTVTDEIRRAFEVPVRLMPVTDDRCRTMVTVVDEGEMTFQEYFVGRHHSVAVTAVRFDGIDAARPAPGVLEALDDAEVIVIAPSNPIVSIGPLLGLLGPRLEQLRSKVVAVSPIVAGAALKGPADRMLTELGHEPSVVGVARLYTSLARALVIDTADAALAADVEGCGLAAVVTDTVMASPSRSAGLARATLAAVQA
ncbi:MAG: fbiA [Acidimicrobiia bacterium]|nr:fbiA [Acidimicrobiia bacterium]